MFAMVAAEQQIALDSIAMTSNWEPAMANMQASTEDPLFCFVVRTYWAHGDAHGGGLRQLIRSLQRQPYDRWEAVMLVADSKPFPDLHKIIIDLNETRAWVFAEWIGSDFAPKVNGTWDPSYHGLLYNLTDDAIQACPPTTRWLVVTNGDNEYAEDFMTRVIAESTQTQDDVPDIIAFDYYSRYHRVTMPACERFAASHAAPLCKPNRLKWCQTDVGASALNWARLRVEERFFGGELYDQEERFLDADSADGLMMEILVREGWKVKHVMDSCSFMHAPSIQSCAWQGGVWDDRDVITVPGGACLTPAEADSILNSSAENAGGQVEQVVIDVSNDGKVEKFENGNADKLKGVRCLRHRDFKKESVLGLTQVWYSQWCADDGDIEEYKRSVNDFFPTDEEILAAQDAALEQVDAAKKEGKS